MTWAGASTLLDPTFGAATKNERNWLAAIGLRRGKKQTNGRPERLNPERLAELTHPPAYKTLEERRAALKQATGGFRVKVRVTPDMYGRR